MASRQAGVVNALQALCYGFDLDASSLVGLAPLASLDPDPDHPAAILVGWPQGAPERVGWSIAEALVDEAKDALLLRVDVSLARRNGSANPLRRRGTVDLLVQQLKRPGIGRDRLADTLGVSRETLRVRLNRAHQDLPGALDPDGAPTGEGIAAVDERFWLA